MPTLGYYIRSAGEGWSLVRVTSLSHDEVVIEGLTYAEAEALYWEKLEELWAKRSVDAAAAELPLGDIAPRRPRQLSLKL